MPSVPPKNLHELGKSILEEAQELGPEAITAPPPPTRIPNDLIPYLFEAKSKHNVSYRRLAHLLARKGIIVSHTTVARALKNYTLPAAGTPSDNGSHEKPQPDA